MDIFVPLIGHSSDQITKESKPSGCGSSEIFLIVPWVNLGINGLQIDKVCLSYLDTYPEGQLKWKTSLNNLNVIEQGKIKKYKSYGQIFNELRG